MDYKELYETNEDFRRYVDRHCRCYGLTVDESLQHVVVHQYAEYLKEEVKE